MFHIVLYQPEIPPNTGNIIRLCSNTGCSLHLIKPIGFQLDNRSMRRAGLDYQERAEIRIHSSLEHFRAEFPDNNLYALSTRGKHVYTDIAYGHGDILLFGPETRGLSANLLQALPDRNTLRIPMKHGNRSLNLANAVAIIVYEAWRQNNFR